jgi:hypothetical protein
LKRILGVVAVVAFFAPTLALAADISGYWGGWSCGINDNYSCPAQVGYYDNKTTLHFASDPTTGTNTATWNYTSSGFYCTSTLTYVSDLGGAVNGSFHWWQFTDNPQSGGCLAGTVVVAVKVGSNEPMEVWWYANNPAYSDSNTIGFLTPFSRG